MAISDEINGSLCSSAFLTCKEHACKHCTNVVVRLVSVTRGNQGIQSTKAVIFLDSVRDAVDFDLRVGLSEGIVHRRGHYPRHVSAESQPDALFCIAIPNS